MKTTLANKLAQIEKIRATVDTLPGDVFLLNTSSAARSDQMSNTLLLFQAILLIRDILDSKEDSDPDVNAILAKLPELAFEGNFDNWMKMFLDAAAAFSTSFVGALEGFLNGCDVFSVLYKGTQLGPTCIRLEKRSDAMDRLIKAVNEVYDKKSASNNSTVAPEAKVSEMENGSIMGLALNDLNSAKSTNSDQNSQANFEKEKACAGVENPSIMEKQDVLTQFSSGTDDGFKVVQNRNHNTSQISGGKLPPTNLNTSQVASKNPFEILDDDDDGRTTEANDSKFDELQEELLRPPSNVYAGIDGYATIGKGVLNDTGANVDLIRKCQDSLDDDLSFSQAGRSFQSPLRSNAQSDTNRVMLKLQHMERQIEQLTRAKDSSAIEAIVSYKKTLREEMDAYMTRASETAALKFALDIKPKEELAVKFLASVQTLDRKIVELQNLTTLASQQCKFLEYYDKRLNDTNRFVDGLSKQAENMAVQLKDYNDEFNTLDEKLLEFTKKISGVSDNSHLDHLKSKLKDNFDDQKPSASPAAPAPSSVAPPPESSSIPSLDERSVSIDDSSVRVEDATVASLDNTAVRNQKRSDFLKDSGGKIMIPAEVEELVVVIPPRDDIADKVYVYKLNGQYIASWQNSDTETAIYPMHTWIQFEYNGNLIWAFIDRYEFTSQAPIYCVQVNGIPHEVHAADVIQHAHRKPQFASATATPQRVRSTSSMKQTTIPECRPFHIETDNSDGGVHQFSAGAGGNHHFPPTPVQSLAAAIGGPPQLKSNEYIYPFDPTNPRVSSVTSVKNLNTGSLQTRLVPLSGIGAKSNMREFYTHIKNLLDDLNVPLRSFDEFESKADLDTLLECTPDTAYGYENLRTLASKLLYQIFEAERKFLLPDDNFSVSSFATYLDNRDGLAYFSKILRRHHPTLSDSSVKEILYGPPFDKMTSTIHDYATDLMKFQRQVPGYSEADIVVHFLRTIDERFKDAKGPLLAIVNRLCQVSNDPVLPADYRLSQIASTVIERCTTDKVQQNVLSGLPKTDPTTTTAYKGEVQINTMNQDAQDKEDIQINAMKNRDSSGNRSNTSSSSYSNSGNRSSSRNSKPRKLCPCCKNFCKDKCLHLGRMLALEDYRRRFPNLDWKQYLREYNENQVQFQQKVNRTFDKRQEIRAAKLDLKEQLEAEHWSPNFVQQQLDQFVQKEIDEDAELLFCSADTTLSDANEPLISL